MGFLFWKRKKSDETEKIKDELKNSFQNVKQDISKISHWIKHLDTKDSILENEIGLIKEEISTLWILKFS